MAHTLGVRGGPNFARDCFVVVGEISRGIAGKVGKLRRSDNELERPNTRYENPALLADCCYQIRGVFLKECEDEKMTDNLALKDDEGTGACR